jgi:hypothetical protein
MRAPFHGTGALAEDGYHLPAVVFDMCGSTGQKGKMHAEYGSDGIKRPHVSGCQSEFKRFPQFIVCLFQIPLMEQLPNARHQQLHLAVNRKREGERLLRKIDSPVVVLLQAGRADKFEQDLTQPCLVAAGLKTSPGAF